MSLSAAVELIRFVSFSLDYEFTLFNPNVLALKEFKQQFLASLEVAISGIFNSDQMSVFFINMSALAMQHVELETYVLEVLNGLLKGSEILTLFTKNKWEELIVSWKMHKKFIGLSNYVLYHLIAYRMQKKLKIVLYYEPQPTKYDSSMEVISSYPKLLAYFSRYTLSTPVDPNNTVTSLPSHKRQSITELFAGLAAHKLNMFKISLVRKLY